MLEGQASPLRGVALLSLAVLCLCWLPTQGQCDTLPSVSPNYYTIITAGFDDLQYSLHYEEYGNTAKQLYLTVGRYYAPTAIEWSDFLGERYYLKTIDPVTKFQTCKTYFMTQVSPTRLVSGVVQLLQAMTRANVTFTNMGATTAVRSQNAVRFSAPLAWSSTTGISAVVAPLDSFIKSAYGTAGIDTSSAYTIGATVDVYFLADANGNMLVAGGGHIPLEYTITGTRTDQYGNRPLNIIYDFIQWSALDSYTATYALNPYTWLCTYPVNNTFPAAIPTAQLQPINTTLPLWSGGRVAIELTSNLLAGTKTPALQIDSLLKPQHGQELQIYVMDPNAYTFYSVLYEYSFVDERDFQFGSGGVYTLNGTDANPYNEWDWEWIYRFCTGSTINPNTVSPLQWHNAGSLLTLFGNPAFLNGISSTGRTSIRGISTDSYSIRKTMAYNGAVYDFTLQLFMTSAGWNNLGRLATSISNQVSPQLVRLAYSGTRTPARGSATPYTLQMDFYLHYEQAWNSYAQTFNPSYYGCSPVASAPILPPLPAQYTVTVSEAWYYSSSSSQYTVYVDTTRNLRRIDGRFTAPNTASVLSTSPINPNYVTMVQWSQNNNVTSLGGFTSTQPFAPYQIYQPNQAATCGTVTLSTFDFNGAGTLNFFDWLATADPSQALYMFTTNIRGVDLDVYQVSVQSENYGRFIVATFQVYYLASDQTLTNTVPVTAEVSVQFYNYPYFGSPNVHYQFFNFRASVPQGIFNTPPPSQCTGLPMLPLPVATPAYYTDPSPDVDGTNKTSPIWPTSFSLLVEGPIFASSGDMNPYVVRWFVDFDNLRERLDIEAAFNMSAVNGVTPQPPMSYLYYYTNYSGSFTVTDGIVVTYDGASCSPNAISTNSLNFLKQVPPGNLFDTFFPQTSQILSNQSIYNSQPRRFWSRFDGFFYDEYDWKVNNSFNGQKYATTQSLYVTIAEWVNNAQAANFSNIKVPLAVQAQGALIKANGQWQAGYNVQFRTTHYQGVNPGIAIFDAALLGCATTTKSPWYNIYGNLDTTTPASSSSSVDTSVVVGAVVGVVGGILVLVGLVAFCRWWKKGNPLFASNKYAGGMSSANGRDKKGNTTDNELVGVGKLASDDNAPENSLNRASLNGLVKEGGTSDELEIEVHDGSHGTAAPSNTNSSDQ